MKKYTNNTIHQKKVKFSDDTGVFLKRGGSYTSDKEAVFVEDGVRVTEVRKTKTRVTKEDNTSSNDSTES